MFDDHFQPQILLEQFEMLSESQPSIYNALYQDLDPKTWTKEYHVQSGAPHSPSLPSDPRSSSDPHSTNTIGSDHSQCTHLYTYTLYDDQSSLSSSKLSISGTGMGESPQHTLLDSKVGGEDYEDDSCDDDSALSTPLVVEPMTRNTHMGFLNSLVDTGEEWDSSTACSDSRQTESTSADADSARHHPHSEDEGYLEHEREGATMLDSLACEEEFEISLMSPLSDDMDENRKGSDDRSLNFMANTDHQEASVSHNMVFDFNNVTSANFESDSSGSGYTEYFQNGSSGIRDGRRRESAVQSVFELSPPPDLELSQQDTPKPSSLSFGLDQSCSSDDYCTSSLSPPRFLLDCPVTDSSDLHVVETGSIDTSSSRLNLMGRAPDLTSNVVCLEGSNSVDDDSNARAFADHRVTVEKKEEEEEEEEEISLSCTN